jgi:hypothetical protein
MKEIWDGKQEQALLTQGKRHKINENVGAA